MQLCPHGEAKNKGCKRTIPCSCPGRLICISCPCICTKNRYKMKISKNIKKSNPSPSKTMEMKIKNIFYIYPDDV